MTKISYNQISTNGRIGLPTPVVDESTTDGPNLPIFLAGSFETKTKTYFKPKIPKSGKSLYRNIYMRSNKGFTYLYDIESTIYIIALHDQIDVKKWIDNNYEQIIRRVKNAKT